MSGRPSGTRGGPMYGMTPAQRAAYASNGAASNTANAAEGNTANAAAGNTANAVNEGAFNITLKDLKALWIKYCEMHGENAFTETIPPRTKKVLEFLKREIQLPVDQRGPFKSGKELLLMFSSGGKRTRKNKRKAKKTKKYRR